MLIAFDLTLCVPPPPPPSHMPSHMPSRMFPPDNTLITNDH